MFCFYNFIQSLIIKNDGSILVVRGNSEYDLVGPKDGKYGFKNYDGEYIKIRGNSVEHGSKPTYFIISKKNNKYKVKVRGKCWERTRKGIELRGCRPSESQLFEFEGDCKFCKKRKDEMKDDESSSSSSSKNENLDDKDDLNDSVNDYFKDSSFKMDENIKKIRNEDEDTSDDDTDDDSKDAEKKKKLDEQKKKEIEEMIQLSLNRDNNQNKKLSDSEKYIRANIIKDQSNIQIVPRNFAKNPENLESEETTEDEFKTRNPYLKGLHEHDSLYKKIYSSPYYYPDNSSDDNTNYMSMYYSPLQNLNQYYSDFIQSRSQGKQIECKKKVIKEEKQVKKLK